MSEPHERSVTLASPGRPARRSAGGRRTAWGSAAGGLLLGALLTSVLVLFVGMPLALTRTSPVPLEALYGETAVNLVVGRAAGSAANPVAGNAEAIAAGADTYKRACAGCHGPTGNGRGGAGGGEYFYPPASNLTASATQDKSDAELHWITKHGLGFTGMPAYGARMDDRKIWNIVAYLRTMPPQP